MKATTEPPGQAKARRDAEAGRQREARQYLESWQAAQGSSLNVALHVDSIGLTELQRSGYVAQPSPDRTLAAFAQLAVLRLGVHRAMVSLIDASTQTILAEATADDDDIATPAGEMRSPSALWLGTTVLARHDAVCEHCLFHSYTATSRGPGPEGRPYSHTAPGFVVPDCSTDSRFQHREYVRDSPFVRFYAGVPITTRSGHKIGAFAVSDPRPRAGLDVQEMRFMQGLAQTIMDHLDWARDRVDRFKGERIVRGLATFVEASSSLSRSFPPSSPAPAPSSPASVSKQPPMTIASPRHPLSRRTSYFGPTDPASESPHGPGGQTHSRLRQPSRRPGDKADIRPDAMARMMSQAVDILRQSTLADGAVILSTAPGQVRRDSWTGTTQDTSSSDDEGEQQAPRPFAAADSNPATEDAAPNNPRNVRLSRVLGCSVLNEQIKQSFEQGHGGLDLATLDKYFALYPRGKTLSFDSRGSTINPSEDDSSSERETPAETEPGYDSKLVRRRLRMDHSELLQHIPGAKTVVFVPLFDHAEDVFTGGCFLWTSVAGRMMTLDDDMSYLRAFANSIMSQSARIKALKNEAAKTTFIANMSHEIRSPLHGILGAAEFLAETARADSFQAGLVASISTCGKTLLDTLNHVLDYSKINKLQRYQLRRSVKKQDVPVHLTPDSMDSLNMTAVVDLSLLVEEVVDTIVTGHTFRRTASTALVRSMSTSIASGLTDSRDSNAKNDDEPVSVLLDISPPGKWIVRTQPGALRRIVMNLLGNALKYTHKGYVLVTLDMEEEQSTTTESTARTHAILRVADTGKGISPEFQRERLYTPFMQEDPFQPGTGLGLSIVKQIVDSMGASMGVTSEQNKGTEFDLRMSLPRAEGPPAAQSLEEAELQWMRSNARGLSMVILDGKLGNKEADHVVDQAQRLNRSISKTCKSWFGLDVAYEEDGATLDADLFMYCEPPSLETLEKRFKHDKTLSKRKWRIPIIIVCLDAQEVLRIAQNQREALTRFGHIVELIPQPCGPRKLAKVIEICLRKAHNSPGVSDHLSTNLGGSDDYSDRAPNTTFSEESSPKKPQLKTEKSGDEWQKQQNVQTEPMSLPRRPAPAPYVEAETEGNNISTSNGETNDDQDKRPAEDREMTTPSSTTPPPPPPPPPPTITISRTRSSSSSNVPHVLLVDDNKINLQLLVMFMKKSGFTYDQAEDGQQALDAYIATATRVSEVDPTIRTEEEDTSDQQQQQQQQESTITTTITTRRRSFDFVLMDLSMPVMDGIESTSRIRQFERENDLTPATIIALTGLASGDAQQDAKNAGVDVFMAKPAKFAALRKIMRP